MAERIFTHEQLEMFREWMEQPLAGKGFLAYHGDADGVCSAAMLLRHFKGFEYTPRKGPIMEEGFVQAVLKKRPGLLVFLDLPVDQEGGKLERFLREIPGLRIIILDHHITEKDVNSRRVLHINPRFLDREAYIPSSCMVYRLLEGMGKDVKPIIWMAALGVIGDYEWRGCSGLMEQAREEFPFLLEGDPLGSRLAGGAHTIAAAATLKGLKGVAECLKALLRAQGFEDFESDRRLRGWRRELEEELASVLDGFERERQVYEGERLMVFEVKSRVNLTSLVSTKLGERLPDWNLVIRKREKGLWKVSLRNQSGAVNLGDVAKRAVKGIGSGGGHERAAGALVSDWDLFLKRVREGLRAS